MKYLSPPGKIGLFLVFFTTLSCLFAAARGQDIPVLAPETAPNTEERLDAMESVLAEVVKKQAAQPEPPKGITTRINGRLYIDSYHVSGDDDSRTPSFRESWNYNGIKDLQLCLTGEGYKNYIFKSDLHFGTDGKVELREVWLSASDVPLLGAFKIGHQRVEEGMSALQSGLFTTFLFFEGSDFLHFYRLGASSRHLWAQDRLRFFAGLYEYKRVAQLNRIELSQDSSWGSIANFRLTYMPYISRNADGKVDGRQFMLFGVNYGHYDVNEPTQIFTERYSQAFGTLQRITIDNVGAYNQVGLEFATQHGPFALVSETHVRAYDRYGGAGDVTAWGLYIEGRVFLTGDHRRFSATQAIWSGVTLKNDLELGKRRDGRIVRHLGAWELAGKWNYVDLRDFDKAELPGLLAPRVHDFTLGLNWYWTERVRVMFNYSRIIPADKVGGHSGLDMFATGFRYFF